MSDLPRNDASRALPLPSFLRHVVDSAFERLGPLEPRRPSLFEKPAGESLNGAWLPENSEERKAHREDDDARERAGHARRTPPYSLGSAEETGLRPAAPPQPAPSSRPRVRVGDRDDDERLTPKPVAMAVESGHEPPRQVPGGTPRRLEESRRLLPEPRATSAGEAIRAEVAGQAAADVHGALLPKRTSEAPDVERQPAARADRTERSAIEPRIPGQGPREPLIESVRTPAPEPVINVTIGRIEVRAAVAQPPSRSRAQAPKPMALDDYLKQRRGGR